MSSFSPRHQRFLERLNALLDDPLAPLPKKQQAAFNKQLKERLAVVKAYAGAAPSRRTRGVHRARAAAVLTGATASVDTAQARLDAILALDLGERDMTDTWRIALRPPPQVSRREAEDAAIGRLLQGIELHRPGTWRKSAPHLDERHRALQAHAKLQTYYGDDGSRLVQLHSRISSSETAGDLSSFYTRLDIQLDTLEFGLRWLAIGAASANGGRSVVKEEFYRNAYLAEFPAADRKTVQQDPEFARWKKNVMGSVVSGRNRLVQVYLKFGFLVLIDPFWDARKLYNNARTTQFPTLVALLLDHHKAPRPPSDQTVASFLTSLDSTYRDRAQDLYTLECELFGAAVEELEEEEGDEEEEEEEEEEEDEVVFELPLYH
ncbi:hypothetical protein GGF50DRAFT_123828 [Schizophyllum commune]